jgi:hypothetical protein
MSFGIEAAAVLVSGVVENPAISRVKAGGRTLRSFYRGGNGPRRFAAAIKRIVAVWLAVVLLVHPARAYICDNALFFEQCPTSDPIFATIISDFKIRKNGTLIDASTLTCTPPISAMPIANYSDELLLLQALRAIYYMDLGRTNHLPWTPKPLYGWLKEKIGGFQISSAVGETDHWPGPTFAGDPASYFVIRAKTDNQRNDQRTWAGLALMITLIMHERRHADGIGHVTCCPAQQPGAAGACDQTYSESVNLSPYGIQYWLEKNWISGFINAGVACMKPADKTYAIQLMRSEANGHVTPAISNFCTNTPPVLTDANNPVGTCGCTGLAGSGGEPHITTFDGLYYDFQAAGDFLLTTSGPSFIVQTRQRWTPNRPNVAFNKAVAMRMGKTRVAVFVEPARLVVDGGQVALADGKTLTLPDDVEISRLANVYTIRHGSAETVRVSVVDSVWVTILGGHFLDVSVALNYAAGGGMRGLLGNGNGDLQDDIATRDGNLLAQPVSFEAFYRRFGASMSIKPEESLFGEDRQTEPGGVVKNMFEAPKKPFTVKDLTRRETSFARAACIKASVEAKPLLDACTLDVAVLRSPQVAKLYTGLAAPAAVMEPGTGIRIMPGGKCGTGTASRSGPYCAGKPATALRARR